MKEFDIATIGKRSVHGVMALISRQFFLSVISFTASLIIFTFLSPKDIGIYTGVTAMQRIISFFTDFGLGAALVQKRNELRQQDLATSFTVQFLLTLCVFVTIFLAREQIMLFFRLSSEAGWLLIALVFSIFLSSFKIIPSIMLERAIRFEKLIIPQIVEALAFNGVLVLLVISGRGIQSYTWAVLISSLLGIPFYYAVSPWQIRTGIDKTSLAHLKYGITFQAKNVLATIKDDLLIVFLVKLVSFTQLGYIGFAQRFAFFTFRHIVDSVTKVTFSTYSRMQDNTVFLKRGIEKSLFFVSAVMFPTLFGLIITAPYLISYMPKWHNKWEPALLSLTFFSLNALISSLSNILVNVLDATGRVKTTLRLMILWTTLTWILTPLLLYFYGYNGVSIASFLVALTIGLTIYLVKKIVDFDFFKSIYKPFISAGFMVAVVFFSGKLFVKDIVTLLLVCLFGLLIYISCLYLFAKKELREDLHFIFAKL